MGRKVTEQLDMKMNEAAFRFGLLGPDPFLFCLPKICRYSSIMHREKVTEFLLEMGKRCKDNEEFSYYCGFLCHYALDAETHPLIVEMSAEGHDAKWIRSMMHIALEHRLDVIYGGNIDIPEFIPDNILDYFSSSVKSIFGWDDAARKFRHGYKCMPAFYLFVRDRYGIFDKLTGWTKGPAAMISNKSRICDGMDFGRFHPLFDRSIEKAIEYINAARAFVDKKIDEAEYAGILGSRPYLTDLSPVKKGRKNDTGYCAT